ncbi:AAA family ATPase [Holophaga foetida]|uniref:AAA family ATPase n=1 Tax=Holophaga foetida TaxID=35839 RepID=UPI0002473344|nr:AAA family ATPase [Holophaga foetida]
MLKQIKKIQDLGIFADYTRPTSMADFGLKNVIYGWNYSGKTTLSRLFGALEHRKLGDYNAAKFTITDATGVITEQDYHTSQKIVRVFNSDFISNNLNFAGSAFNPILLLGEESKDAEQNIEQLQKKLVRCEAGANKSQRGMTSISTALAAEKTRASAAIKARLGLIPAFGATQLTTYMTTAVSGTDYKLSDETLANDLVLAKKAESDKPSAVTKATANLLLAGLHQEASALLRKVPEFSNTIQHLLDQAEVSEWVETGLSLHDHKDKCEFCGNPLTQARLAELHGHFSKDLMGHKASLNALLQRVDAAKVAEGLKQESDFNPPFRNRLKDINCALTPAVTGYNAELGQLIAALQEKVKTPFVIKDLAPLDDQIQTRLQDSITALNALIDENNAIGDNFAQEKNNAIERLKRHFTQEFVEREKPEVGEARSLVLSRRRDQFIEFKNILEVAIKQQKAIISLAQKGREEINRRIENLLGSDNIQIAVVKEGDAERFQLMRGPAVAKNLSEGEKTAIAFAFFLTKLQEIKALGEAIIFIDDPISSLDSNHIFQVAAIIKATFFFQDASKENKWCLRCKQIFLSTHNFDFFTLLRELPINEKESSYYMVKRVTPTTSTFIGLPESIRRYSSEYHYLFNVLYEFNDADDKTDLGVLLSVPNAIRRFLELYTYARCPDHINSTVDRRADRIFGVEESKRILKVLHTFSHSNNIERIATNNDLICDIEGAVKELMTLLEKDEMHFAALKASVT